MIARHLLYPLLLLTSLYLIGCSPKPEPAGAPEISIHKVLAPIDVRVASLKFGKPGKASVMVDYPDGTQRTAASVRHEGAFLVAVYYDKETGKARVVAGDNRAQVATRLEGLPIKPLSSSWVHEPSESGNGDYEFLCFQEDGGASARFYVKEGIHLPGSPSS